VLPEITQTGGAQESVGYCVGDHVGVAVAVQATLAFQNHPAQNQAALGIIGKGVDVKAQPDPDLVSHRR
jgi:hypothetical protein